ncbi:hypothetical protein ACUH92_08820 [Dermabacteraceae bacterium CCM 9520]
MPAYIDLQYAARLTGLTRANLYQLKETGFIASDENDKLSEDDVMRYGSYGAKHRYESGLKNIEEGDAIAFAAPLTGQGLDPKLALSQKHGLARALEALEAAGRPLKEDEFITGWWAISDEKLERLLEDEAPILGVVGGVVVEAAQICGVSPAPYPRNRKALILRKVSESRLEELRGYVPRINQSGVYVKLPAAD